jgi:hypothetical protein
VVERHGAERLDERDAVRRVELVLDAPIDDAHVTSAHLLRAIADRSKSKLGNAWREALIARSPMTKNEARAAIAEHEATRDLLERRLTELPRDALEDLLAALSE